MTFAFLRIFQATVYKPSGSLNRKRCPDMTEVSCCVLDEESFRQYCQLFLQRSEQLRDGWSWEPVQGSDEGYLKKTALKSVPVSRSPHQKHEGSVSYLQTCSSCSSSPTPPEEPVFVASFDPDCVKGQLDDEDDGELDDEDDGGCMVTEGCSLVLQYEYHVLYSCSYSTPVLYFRASTLEGRSLTLEEVWSFIHPNFRLRLQNCPLNVISQQEHPLLGQPFFFLHPCRTDEFMRPMMRSAQDQRRPVNYVLLWLSLVGPVVGLDVPLEYSMNLHPLAPVGDV